jgi:hypothetical protein
MRIRNIFISIIMLGLAGYGGVKGYMYFSAKSKIDKILSFAVMLGAEPSYDRVATSVFGPVGIQGLKLRFPQIGEEITFGEVTLQKFEYQDNMLPTKMRFTVSDMRFNLDVLERLEKYNLAQAKKQNVRIQTVKEEMPEFLVRLGYVGVYLRAHDWRRLGYHNMVMDWDIDMQLRPALQEATMILSQRVENLGSMNLYMDMSDIGPSSQPSILGVKFKEIRIDYKDDSYIDRIIKSYADDNSKDLETYRKEFLTALDLDITSKEIKLSPESIINLKTFLSKPDKLKISMHPYQPVAAGSINHYKPGDVPLLLNLKFD